MKTLLKRYQQWRLARALREPGTRMIHGQALAHGYTLSPESTHKRIVWQGEFGNIVGE